jgi:hypothetical protein
MKLEQNGIAAMTGLVTTYKNLTANQTRSLQQVASQPANAREIAYFKANIGNIKTVDDFVGNTRIFNFAMQAFGLQDMAYAKAFMKKALNGGVSSSDSFANKLSDTRFRNFVSAFNFAAKGAATTSSATLVQTTVDKYTESKFEQQAGDQSDGLRLALNFKAQIGSVSSVYGILGNAALYQVVRTTLNLPQAMSSVDIDKQAKIIGDKFSLTDMKDPKKLDAFLTRFVATYDMQNTDTSSTDSGSVLSLFNSGSTGVDMNTLLALQSIKRFGS